MIIDLLKENKGNDNVYSFRVTNPKISVNFDLEEIIDKGHTSAQSSRGIIILCKNAFDDIWHNVNIYVTNNFDIIIDLRVFLDTHEIVDVLIYGPLYTKFTKLLVSCEDGMVISPEGRHEITVMGGQDTFGSACTTTALNFSNILQRKNDNAIQRYCYDQRDYTKSINGNIEHNSSEILILELNNHIDADKLYSLIKSYDFKYLFLWYYDFNDENLFNRLQKEYTLRELRSKNDLNNCKWNEQVYSCAINRIDEDYFNEFCTINNKVLNDSGHIFIYNVIQKFFDGVLK